MVVHVVRSLMEFALNRIWKFSSLNWGANEKETQALLTIGHSSYWRSLRARLCRG
jgi:hypothetical protein